MGSQAAGSKRKANGSKATTSSSPTKKAKLQIRPKSSEGKKHRKPTKSNSPGESDDDNDADKFEASDDDMLDFSDSEDGGVSLKTNEPRDSESSDMHSSREEQVKETSRESHQKQKALAKERKATKPLADEISRTKKLWERLRRKSHIPAEERKKLVEELFSIITGRMKDLVLKHDATRAIQTAIKYASAEQRKMIARELVGSYATLASGRYAKFLVCKLISYSDNEIRDLIVPEFYGKIRKMIHHPEASWTLEDIYRVAASKNQRAIILREWYGPEFNLLDDKKENPTADLKQILEENPAKRGVIMKNLFQMINGLVQKGLVGFSMLHDAMFQYFTNLPRDSSEFKDFYEMIRAEETSNLLNNLAFTKSGAHLICLFLTLGTAKDRRAILKTYKSNFVMMSGDANAHRIILTSFDVIDDTKMTAKAIFPELFGETFEQAGEALVATSHNLHAHMVLLYLFENHGLDTMFTGPKDEVKNLMAEVHELRKETSKKDPEIRRKELIAHMSPQLVRAVADAGNQLIHDHYGCQLMGEILFVCEGDKSAALATVANSVGGDPTSMIGAEEGEGSGLLSRPHPALTVHGGRLIKALISGGKFDKTTGTTQRVEPPLKFADVLFPIIKEHVVKWATGPSSFVIVNMLDSPDFDFKSELRKILKKSLTEIERAAKEGGTQKFTKESVTLSAKQKKKNNRRPVRADPGNRGSQIILERLS